jgi:hypothetical protein
MPVLETTLRLSLWGTVRELMRALRVVFSGSPCVFHLLRVDSQTKTDESWKSRSF